MFNKLVLSLFLAVLAVGCAKEKEYDDKFKDEKLEAISNFLKTDSDGKKTKYLYVPMTLGTPRQVARANPFYQGQVKIVNIDFTEAGLAVYEVEKDDRFSENDLNQSPVMLIPGKYKDYQCKEDQYGDCTNAEEENTETTWDKKKFFLPDFESIKLQEVNELDLYNIDGDDCVAVQGKAKLVDYEISKTGVINVELEKTYKVNRSRWECIRRNYIDDNLSASSFKVRFFYSMVKLENLASPDYEPLEYQIPDHSVYGFFKSEEKKLNDVFDPSRENTKYLVNRWNPNKTVLKYYLSKSYNKPKNKGILDVTMKSMVIMNKNLAAAGAKFKLEFVQQNESDNISPGDLRHNTIVLIDDPLANGLLGYAPSVKNPETGEIVQSHINMYGGVLRSGTKFVYEQAIDIMKAEKQATIETAIEAGITLTNAALVSSKLPSGLIPGNTGNANVASESIVMNRGMLNSVAVAKDYNYDSRRDVRRVSIEKLKNIENAKMRESVDLKKRFDDIMSGNAQNYDEIDKKLIEEQRLENAYSLDETLAPEFFPIAGTVKVVYPGLKKIEGILNAEGILKNWTELSEKQKDQVAEVIMVNRYASTFVHEMGHSLGLRHNFAGSTDASNFYTDVEAQVLGMIKAPAYSSVMDYAASEYNELASFGKYDVAALMFAYSGKMQTKDGTGIKITDRSKPLRDIRSEYNAGLAADSGKKIVDFAYCTDDNASLSTMCNRFDEGTTLVEIANQRIERYKNFYKLRNFRDGKSSFTAYNEDSYFFARYREFFKLRDIVEDYEQYVGFYGAGLMENGCSPADSAAYPEVCKRINDRTNSVKVVGDFFMEVLKTPDLICAVANKDKPKIVVSYEKLSKLYSDIKYSIKKHLITSCFDENIKAELAKKDLVVVGENGKFLNGFKDTNPNYRYSTDWAVRGIWADKVAAFRMLFQRVSGVRITDTEHMALIDIPYIRAKVENYLEHVVLGKALAEPLPFKTEDGKSFQIPYVIGNDYEIAQLEDNNYWTKKYLGMSDQGDSNLTQVVLKQLNKIETNFSDDTVEKVYETLNIASVRKDTGFINPDDRLPGLESLFLNDVTYQMGKENKLAYYMATAKKVEPVLKSIGQERILEIYMMRVNPTAPAELSEMGKAFFGLELGFQNAIIQNALASKTNPEGKFALEVFEATFPEAIAKPLHEYYLAQIEADAVEMIEINKLKVKMMNVPFEGATEEEKVLFEYDAPTLEKLLQDFFNGAMSPEVFKFYDLQLRKLPFHFNRYDI